MKTAETKNLKAIIHILADALSLSNSTLDRQVISQIAVRKAEKFIGTLDKDVLNDIRLVMQESAQLFDLPEWPYKKSLTRRWSAIYESYERAPEMKAYRKRVNASIAKAEALRLAEAS